MSNCNRVDIDDMAQKFKALSTPVRLKIYGELLSCCSAGDSCDIGRCIGDFSDMVDVAPSTLSHHIKVLSEAGLIDMQRDGKNILCRVNTEALVQFNSYFKL